jgi:hypothetical protein
MACLLKRDIEVRRSRTKRHINRRQALIFEKEQIARLLAKGFMLANWQHNPYRHKDPSRAVRAILSKKLRPG